MVRRGRDGKRKRKRICRAWEWLGTTWLRRLGRGRWQVYTLIQNKYKCGEVWGFARARGMRDLRWERGMGVGIRQSARDAGSAMGTWVVGKWGTTTYHEATCM
jgi:hypothetical protein